MQTTSGVPPAFSEETRAVRDEAGRIADLQIVYVNAEAERATGVPREAQVGVRLREAVRGFDESELFAKLARLIETGQPTGGYETPWWRGDRGAGIFLAE